MSQETDHNLAVHFLRDQMNEVDGKIERLQDALQNCEDCLETDGLQASLHNAELERSLLDALLMNQLGTRVLSLEAMVMQQIEQYRREANRLAQHWHRGQQTPPAYWEADVRQGYLAELLSRFHACQDERPYYDKGSDAQEDKDETAFPWLGEEPEHPGAPPVAPEDNTLREAIFSALRRGGFPLDHVHVIIQSGGQVMVTGYAHTSKDREHILRTIMGIDGVQQVMSDIKVIDSSHCPTCNGGAG